MAEFPTSEIRTLTLRAPVRRAFPSDVTRSSALGTVAAFLDRVTSESLTLPAPSPTTGLAFLNPPDGNLLMLACYGTGADNATGKGRLWGFDALPADADPASRVVQWIPTLLCAWDLALSARTGVAGGNLGTGYRVADTLTLTDDRTITPNGTRTRGPGSGGVGSTTPDDSWAWLVVDTLGCSLLAVELTRNGTAGTDAATLNALLRGL